MKKVTKISKNIDETDKIAKIFLNEIFRDKNQKKGATVVGLSGDLGAGKTAFAKSVAKHLGIKEKVSSPTFVIYKKYTIKKTKDYKFLFHLDAYRLENEKELLKLGWEEIISDKSYLIFIEWPENVKKVMPRHSRNIHILNDEKGSRKLTLK